MLPPGPVALPLGKLRMIGAGTHHPERVMPPEAGGRRIGPRGRDRRAGGGAMHSRAGVDTASMTGASTTDDESRASSRRSEVRCGAVELERALPIIRARLNARYDELGALLVDACLSAAVNASASFRLQEFRVILVERQADRALRELRQRPARRGPKPLECMRVRPHSGAEPSKSEEKTQGLPTKGSVQWPSPTLTAPLQPHRATT